MFKIPPFVLIERKTLNTTSLLPINRSQKSISKSVSKGGGVSVGLWEDEGCTQTKTISILPQFERNMISLTIFLLFRNQLESGDWSAVLEPTGTQWVQKLLRIIKILLILYKLFNHTNSLNNGQIYILIDMSLKLIVLKLKLLLKLI